MQKVKTLGALVVFSGSLSFPLTAGASIDFTHIQVNRENAPELGLSYDKILSEFLLIGLEVNHSDEFLIRVHSESQIIDLSTLDGISVVIPIDDIRDCGADAPRNIL